MPKHIAVPTSWNVYEVENDFIVPLPGVGDMSPPHVVMEVMALSGMAKLVATISPQATSISDGEEEEDENNLDGPWFESE